MLVYPSTMEGFGLPPIEAMACGTPVITSSVGAIPEVVKENALYINPESINDIRLAIEELFNSQELRNDLIKRGNERVKEFSWEKTAVATRSVLEYVRGGYQNNEQISIG